MNCSVALTINKDYLTLSDSRSTLLITMLGSVLSATIIITLYCQSFYNSQHTPSLNFAGKISPPSPSLKRPHPSIHQHAHKHKLGEPTCWSVTDGGLAIVVPLLQKDFASLYYGPSTLATATSHYVLDRVELKGVAHRNWNEIWPLSTHPQVFESAQHFWRLCNKTELQLSRKQLKQLGNCFIRKTAEQRKKKHRMAPEASRSQILINNKRHYSYRGFKPKPPLEGVRAFR